MDIRVDQQTFKQALAKMQAHDFDIARTGFCGGSLTDPVFFANVFLTDSPDNSGACTNPACDELMALTHSTADQTIRMQAFGSMH